DDFQQEQRRLVADEHPLPVEDGDRVHGGPALLRAMPNAATARMFRGGNNGGPSGVSPGSNGKRRPACLRHGPIWKSSGGGIGGRFWAPRSSRSLRRG